jgi:DHA3 family macrolide efflux protein-like MFS transporter
MAGTAATHSMWSVFRKRDFTTLWTAQLVSTIGSSLTDLAAGLYVYRETQSALNVGLVLMMSALPTLLVGLVAGVFVDRIDRKRILQGSDLIRAFLVFLIPMTVPVFGLPALYVLLLLSATVRQFFDPAWESVLPEIASEEELASANAFLSISSFGSNAIGFAMAGILFVVDPHLPFWVDAVTFLFSFAMVSLSRIKSAPVDETTTVAVVVENLRVGAGYLWTTPILRSALLVGIPVYLSIGIWNVLLLPMAIKVLGASEFEYGLQEGITSIGFVVASLLAAKYMERLTEGAWIVSMNLAQGITGILYSLSPNIAIAIGVNLLGGFFNAPAGIARRTLLQKNVPREMRGRVFSAFFVVRDVIFLIGMAAAGLADIFDVRMLIAASAVLLVVSAIWTQFMPGLGQPAAEWRRAAALLRGADAAGEAAAGRAATMVDFDRLLTLVPELRSFDAVRRRDFLNGASVRHAASGEALVKVGDEGDAAYFVLDGRAVAGIPTEDGGSRSLSAMGPGDFFGEIAALMGTRRTANVVADQPTTVIELPATTLRGLMADPAMERLINSKMSERLGRTASPDLVRLARPDQGALRDLRRRRRPAGAPGPGPGAGTGEAGAAS